MLVGIFSFFVFILQNTGTLLVAMFETPAIFKILIVSSRNGARSREKYYVLARTGASLREKNDVPARIGARSREKIDVPAKPREKNDVPARTGASLSEKNDVPPKPREKNDVPARIGARSREKNDVHARMGKTLIKPGTIGKGDTDTVLVEGEYQQSALIVCFEKGQSDDDVFKKEVSIVSNVCDANHNFVKVYGVDSDRDFNYVATEHCGSMGLREFVLSSPAKDHMILLKLISGIVTGIVHLHAEGIFLGNLDLGDISVDKYYNAKISVITTKTKFPLISSSKGATDNMLALDMLALDMLALGRVIFFCFTSVEYKNENLNNLNLSLEALDLLRELLDKHPAQRRTALQVRNHPLLWVPSKKLEFIQAASDHLQGKITCVAIGSTTASIPIDDIRKTVFGEEWRERLDKEFLDAMENDGTRKHIYKSDSMYALLRIIRDLKNHAEKIETQLRSKPDGVPKEVLEIFQPGGIESYFFKRYPKLVMEVYNLMKQHCDENTKIHKLYFK